MRALSDDLGLDVPGFEQPDDQEWF